MPQQQRFRERYQFGIKVALVVFCGILVFCEAGILRQLFCEAGLYELIEYRQK